MYIQSFRWLQRLLTTSKLALLKKSSLSLPLHRPNHVHSTRCQLTCSNDFYLSCCRLSVTDLCNASLKQGCLPRSQRHAIITPWLKKAGSHPSDVQNYRPVSNLTFLSKVIEKLVVNWFYLHTCS